MSVWFKRGERPTIDVLLVEDNPRDIEIAMRTLDAFDGAKFHVQAVTTASQCLTALRESKFDVILLDHNLPGQSGLDLLASARKKHQVLPPVIVITGQTDHLVAKETIRSGADDYFSKDSLRSKALGEAIVSALTRVLREKEEERLRAESERQAFVDPLTELYNRRYLNDVLERECRRAGRYGISVACLMIDLDRYKEINDEYGHPAGDSVLKQIAGFVRTSLRDSDTVFRYGGDEIFVLLPETGLEEAVLLAERVRLGISTMQLIVGRSRVSVSASIGVFCPRDRTQLRPHSLVDLADAALRAAKLGGRNQVHIYGSTGADPLRRTGS